MLFLRLNRFDRNNLECMNVKDWMPRPQECFGSDLNSSMQAQIGSFSQSLMCLFAIESSSASIQVLLKLYVLSSNEICEVMNSFKILSFVWAEISKLFVTFNKDFNFVDKASLASSFFIVKLNILPKYVKESPIGMAGMASRPMKMDGMICVKQFLRLAIPNVWHLSSRIFISAHFVQAKKRLTSG